MKTMTALLAAALVLSGCAQYTYFGRIEAKDSADQDRDVVVYWTKTERKLWFDTASGGVRVLTECSTNAIDYEEKPQGIVFLRRPSDVPVGPDIALGAPCGQVLGATRVKELDVGALELTVHCRPDVGDEFAIASLTHYPKARDEPYRFPIQKSRTGDLAAGAPQPRPCRR
jgi:hypothetical protein